MTTGAVERFISLADSVIRELEQVIVNGDDRYPNAAIALKNARDWRDRAARGTLPSSFGPTFGLSKSDLMFGPVEERMYELERLFETRIRPYFEG
ncbi:hypothetical protein EC912_102796 [Luteibacter rhizovicinus]|uniref:Uncharacterized protein n=1 Tax=Luteibacter rhizovicinus TaxID=242606 RepID=A0A4R3YTS1_9GAMM|nr:hypothetical protein [Luteibacter rhizovicinus]TCV96445.1 hypothetical protein EC912_102796 [Luteibacter rhizovicinus]